jgi:alkanesulfonate monooxygenase SsuD/methylene tetrahydromethanopterin reductase-like flavin-dependent oxidoreductase (luciferase family)
VNFLPLRDVEQVITEIRTGEREAGKQPGSSDVVCRFFCIPQPASEGMALARWMFSAYATVPVYEAYFRWLGWGDAIDPMVEAWRAGDRQRALEGAPEELINEIFIFGDAGEQKLRLAEFVENGITTPVLTPICPPDQLAGVIDALAP